MNNLELSQFILKVLEEYKGIDIVNLDVKMLTNICDNMIICSATSTRHAITLADKLIRMLREENWEIDAGGYHDAHPAESHRPSARSILEEASGTLADTVELAARNIEAAGDIGDLAEAGAGDAGTLIGVGGAQLVQALGGGQDGQLIVITPTIVAAVK